MSGNVSALLHFYLEFPAKSAEEEILVAFVQQFPRDSRFAQGKGLKRSLLNQMINSHLHRTHSVLPCACQTTRQKNPMEDPKSLPGWASSFDDLLDKRVLVLLVDGRKIVGTLRSYDQFANIMIDEAYERHIADNFFADVFLGVLIVRGENLALFGESTDDGSLVEAPVDVVFRRQEELIESSDTHHRAVTVDLGFLDDI